MKKIIKKDVIRESLTEIFETRDIAYILLNIEKSFGGYKKCHEKVSLENKKKLRGLIVDFETCFTDPEYFSFNLIENLKVLESRTDIESFDYTKWLYFYSKMFMKIKLDRKKYDFILEDATGIIGCVKGTITSFPDWTYDKKFVRLAPELIARFHTDICILTNDAQLQTIRPYLKTGKLTGHFGEGGLFKINLFADVSEEYLNKANFFNTSNFVMTKDFRSNLNARNI